MNIVFMGSPEFAVPTLEKIIESSHNVLAVFSQPPRPAGRGQKVKTTPVHALAEKHNIPVFTPVKLTQADFDQLNALKPDVIVVVAYGLILPKAVLDVAPCINLHPSALPKWRGAAPMNYPVLHGEAETDICIMEMEEGLDSGPVYLRETYTIGENETAGELHDRFKDLGAEHMVKVLDEWVSYKDAAIPQEGETCYAHKFKTEDLSALRQLVFEKSALELHNQIRGLSPWPGAVCLHGGVEVKVLASKLSTHTPRGVVGEVLAVDDEGIHVNTAQGVVCFVTLQRAGKRAMAAADFVKGYPVHVGEVFA